MTAMPCGQKKRTSEMIQSQTVTPPFAAMEGTTLRLKTATTKSRTRSQRPRTRLRCGASCASATGRAVVMTSFDNDVFPRREPIPSLESVPCRTHLSNAVFLLRSREGGRNFFEDGKVLINIRFGVLHGNGPLLVPPIRLRDRKSTRLNSSHMSISYAVFCLKKKKKEKIMMKKET